MKNLAFLLTLFFISHFLHAQNSEKVIVYFDFNSAVVKEPYAKTLDSIIASTPIQSIQIAGYCDAIGNDDYNDKLGMKRAMAISKCVALYNVNPEKSSLISFGKRKPINSNLSKNDRALNRRVEVNFIFKTMNASAENEIKKDVLPQVANDDTSKFVAELTAAEVGTALRLPNLNFYPGRHILLPSAKETMEKLLKILQDLPTMKIEIDGYICCLEDLDRDGYDWDEHTNDLSVYRAKEVYRYLVTNGIDSSRLKYVGFGAKNKLVVEHSEADMTLNRRVEIKILSK